MFANFGATATKRSGTTKCMKLSPDGHHMGTIVVVGGNITYPSTTTNIDIRKSSRTGAGYHDEPGNTDPPAGVHALDDQDQHHCACA